MVRSALVRQARQGKARPGLARRGEAGAARQIKAAMLTSASIVVY